MKMVVKTAKKCMFVSKEICAWEIAGFACW
jgi:hypothetical protein